MPEQCENPILHSGDSPARNDFSDAQFNYAATFAYMARRRLQRQFRGVYAAPSKSRSLVLHAVCAYVIAVMTVGSGGCTDQNDASFMSARSLVGAFIAAMVITESLRSSLVLMLGLCAATVHAWYFSVTRDIHLFSRSRQSQLQSATVTALGLFEVAIIVVYLAMNLLYPAIVSRVETPKWFNVKRGRRANTITYRALTVHKFWRPRKQFTIQYTGGLDRNFRPHGFGVWKDTSYHGETLSGAWEHGIPIGPFSSREHGSGYASQQIRIAFASYRSESTPTAVYISPSFPYDKKLKWGVARVECSVAGGFFRFLPSVDYFFGTSTTNAPQSARECLSTLRTPLDSVCSTGTENQSASIRRSVCSSSFRGFLEPETISLYDASNKPEALIFIHGMDYSLENAIKLFGQLLTLGDFPSHIHPFSFSWASGNTPFLSYWSAKRKSESKEIATVLCQFVSSIIDAGYSRIHFISHSMGSRMFLNAIERGTLRQLFLNKPKSASIASVTMCSPKYPLARFVAAGGGYDALREYCSLITIYGDKWDWALRVSELANPENSEWGRFVKSLGRSIDSIVRDTVHSNCYECAVPDPVDDTATAAIEAVSHAAGYPGVVMFSHSCTKSSASDPQSYGSVPEYDDGTSDSEEAMPRVYLDLDVINTSFTDTNVGSRHSYFQVSETIAADMRELILHKRRAKRRVGLMRQRGNIFIFLAAPKDVL